MVRCAPPFAALMLATAISAAWAAGDAVTTADPPAAAGERPATPDLAPIDAAAAADHIGEERVVEMVVRAARALADKDICFLNSRRDRRDRDNFTAVIFTDGLERFRGAGIENPALHYLDRRIRVRGVISEHEDRPQIVVKEPGQIELVEPPADVDPKE